MTCWAPYLDDSVFRKIGSSGEFCWVWGLHLLYWSSKNKLWAILILEYHRLTFPSTSKLSYSSFFSSAIDYLKRYARRLSLTSIRSFGGTTKQLDPNPPGNMICCCFFWTMSRIAMGPNSVHSQGLITLGAP